MLSKVTLVMSLASAGNSRWFDSSEAMKSLENLCEFWVISKELRLISAGSIHSFSQSSPETWKSFRRKEPTEYDLSVVLVPDGI